jgi:transposase
VPNPSKKSESMLVPARRRLKLNLSEAQRDEINRLVTENSGMAIGELVSLIRLELGVSIGERTLRDLLKSWGFVRVVPPSCSRQKGSGEDIPAGEEVEFRYQDRHRNKPADAVHFHGLTDREWEVVKDIFDDTPRGQPVKYSRRSMLDAMLYVLRAGVPWRMLPAEFPPWNQVYRRFQKWYEQGRFRALNQALNRFWRKSLGRNELPSKAFIDSQSVKTSPQGGPRGYDAGKKVKGRKRHIMTDTLGLILAVVVHSANLQDHQAADEVVKAGLEAAPRVTLLVADSAYAGRCRERLEASHSGLRVEISRRPNNRNIGVLHNLPLFGALPEMQTKPGFKPVDGRWIVEQAFAHLGRCRRLAIDQDRTKETAEAWIHLASSQIVWRRIANGPAAHF